MRILLAAAAIAASVALGGCFHHQATVVETPQALPPLK
jgi:hypothetical protein